MTGSGALLAEWARTWIESLADAGVELAVVSPGSRSTPLVWALTATKAITVRVVPDERAAAFHAVGHAKIAECPALLVCTSGSAGAHYLPAIVEASHAGVPLLVVTADRPPELQGCAAPQTIDQIHLFGRHVRDFVELGMPDPSPEAFRGLRRIAAQAVRTAMGPCPGPVHVNFKARKPLEPPSVATDESRAAELIAVATVAVPPTRSRPPRLAPDAASLDDLAGALRTSRRPLFVAGPAPTSRARLREAWLALVGRAGGVLLPEATSQLRFGAPAPDTTVADAFPHLLDCEPFRGVAFGADCIVQLGRPPTLAAWERHVAATAGTPRFVLADDGWPDPAGTATAVVTGDAELVFSGLAQRLEDHRTTGDAAWRRAWRGANEATWRAVAESRRGGALGETLAVERVLAALPDGAVLCLGNSLPIRHVDRVPATERALHVWSQRGANGIDGLVSGACGAAAAARSPTALVVGDVSFLHDLGGLWCARALTTPMAIVVLHNDGGRIFEHLPAAARLAGEPERLDAWLTPHGLDLAHAARLFGLEHAAPTTPADLDEALEGALRRPGATVVEVRVPPGAAFDETRTLAPTIARAVGAAVREPLT